MTKIDFYTGSADKLRTACQLSHKAMQNGVHVALSAPDAAAIDALDKLLWHYPATAFIPHCRSDAEEAAQCPVVLNSGVSFFSRFERVIEIVSGDAEDSRKGRERYKFYKDRGYELRHIDLSGHTP